MNYVMAGVFGNYELYKNMLKKIKFNSKDLLFVLGNVIGGGTT